jgi:ATP-binding cassette, subfamily B, bacterial
MKKNPYILLLKTSWKYAYDQKYNYCLIYLLFLIANFILALRPFLYGWFIDGIQRNAKDLYTDVWTYVCSFIGLVVLQWLFHGPARLMERKLAFSISKNFFEELFLKTLNLPIEWHLKNHTGGTVNRINKSHLALRSFFQNGFNYLNTLVQTILSFAAMLYFSPFYGMICLGISLITVILIFVFDKHYIRALEQVNEGEHSISSKLSDGLSNIITVITLRVEALVGAELLRKFSGLSKAYNRSTIIGEWKWFTANFLVAIAYSVIIIGYTTENYTPGKVFLIGGLVTLIGFVNQFNAAFFNIAAQYSQIAQYYIDLKSSDEIILAHQRSYPISNKTHKFSNEPLELRNINFNYGYDSDSSEFSPNPNGHLKAFKGLHDINLQLNNQCRIVIIGESGSGKSTLFALLRGIYQPALEAQVIVGLNDTLTWNDLAVSVSLLPQEPEIFESTVEYNITLGISFTTEAIFKACDVACFMEVIEKLPMGLNTMIGERGSNLSAGQRQRLALVRGILTSKDSSIVILDEATNRVDAVMEETIYRNLFEHFKDKRMVCSTHNPQLLRLFDYVYVMKEGKIIEEGIPSRISFAKTKVV